MFTRRLFVFAAACGLSVAASGSALAAPVPNDPLAIINAIYARVISGNGDLGGAFMMEDQARPKYFSKSLIGLWAKADARTPKGDQGPIDFDPATNSQDPSIQSFSATAEKIDSGTATIVVKLQRGREQPHAHAEDDVIKYDFVRDGGHWKIDDIRGTVDAKTWSLRQKITSSLKP